MKGKVYTVKSINEFLSTRNCKMNLDGYEDFNQRVKTKDTIIYLDANGHRNEKKLKGILWGTVGCKECKKKYDIEGIKRIFEEKGCKLLSKKYIDNKKQKLVYLCPNGHENETNLYNFINRKTYDCEQCRKDEFSRKIEIEAKKRNCELIEINYNNQNSTVNYICIQGHECEQSADNFLRGFECLRCQNKEKYTLKEIREEFENVGCILLANEYKNAHEKMKFLCICGDIGEKRWNTFQRGFYYCNKCRFERYTHPSQLTYEVVYRLFEEQGCKLISKEYKGKHKYLAYICQCGDYDTKPLTLFKKGYRCEKCEKSKNQEKENIEKDLTRYLRKCIEPWKNDSYNKYGGKCVVTKREAKHIHHLYSFHKIVNETFIDLNLPKYKDLSKYTKDQLILIKGKLLSLHYYYGLGVPLSVQVHRLMHSFYGHNVSKGDFKRFCKSYKSLLKEIKNHLQAEN